MAGALDFAFCALAAAEDTLLARPMPIWLLLFVHTRHTSQQARGLGDVVWNRFFAIIDREIDTHTFISRAEAVILLLYSYKRRYSTATLCTIPSHCTLRFGYIQTCETPAAYMSIDDRSRRTTTPLSVRANTTDAFLQPICECPVKRFTKSSWSEGSGTAAAVPSPVL